MHREIRRCSDEVTRRRTPLRMKQGAAVSQGMPRRSGEAGPFRPFWPYRWGRWRDVLRACNRRFVDVCCDEHLRFGGQRTAARRMAILAMAGLFRKRRTGLAIVYGGLMMGVMMFATSVRRRYDAGVSSRCRQRKLDWQQQPEKHCEQLVHVRIVACYRCPARQGAAADGPLRQHPAARRRLSRSLRCLRRLSMSAAEPPARSCS